MSLTLQQIRDHVYEFLELDEDDVPTGLIDTWATEGFLRIIKNIKKWPHYQQRVTFDTVNAQQAYDRDDEFAGLRSVISVAGPNGEMRYGQQGEMQEHYFRSDGTTAQGRPDAYSVWADTYYFWPVPNDTYTITVLGYREPVIFGSSATSEPDLPEHFHQLVRSWVLYRAYLHQDDTELAGIELQQFDGMLDMFISEETRDDMARPMIYGGSRKRSTSLPRELRADYTTWTN